MKTPQNYLTAAIAIVLCILLGACTSAPTSWSGKPNPLDVPDIRSVEPEANGYWGPFGVAPSDHRGNFTGSP